MFTLRVVCGARVTAKASRFTVHAVWALGLCWFSTSNASAQSGWVLQYTGQLEPPGVRTQEVPACYGGTYCQFWEELDRNAFTARIAVAGGQLYQLQYSGAIFKYPSTPCSSQCPGWHLIDYDPATKAIFGDDRHLFKMRQDGSIWRRAGRAWSVLEMSDPQRITMAAGGGIKAYLYADGRIGTSTSGFTKLCCRAVAIAIDAGRTLYQLRESGEIDLEESSQWKRLDNNPATIAIAAGGKGKLYQLHNNGSIWRFTGARCNFQQPPPYCPGWEKLDNNPATVRIVATDNELYQLHDNGSLWRWTGTACNGDSCPGWELLIADGIGRIAVAGNRVYALAQPVARSARQRVCDECL